MKTTNEFTRLLICTIALLCGALLGNTQAQPSTRIMPLGDSITEGHDVAFQGGYRTGLYSILENDGYVVDFVGSASSGLPALLDKDHEGHEGFKIEQIRSDLPFWQKKTTDPDVILLHIGTNDFWAGNSLSVTQNRMRGLLTDLTNMWPHAKIIVASLILRTDNATTEANQVDFNLSIPGIVAEYGGNVSFLDMHAELDTLDLDDGVHPTLVGYDKMADAWLPAISSVIAPSGTSDLPAVALVDAREDLNQVKVTFSKPVEDVAATPANFSISGGVTVSAAVLDASKRVITLTTSAQSPGTLYDLSVSGVEDRTPLHHEIAPGTVVEFSSRTVIDGSFEVGSPAWQKSGNYTVLDSPVIATEGSKVVVFNDGNSAPDGVITQDISTVPGQIYQLTFDMGVDGNSFPQSLEVSVDGNLNLLSQTEVLSTPAGDSSTKASKLFEFTADSTTTTVTFSDVSTETTDVDLLVDDVQIRAEEAPSPILTVDSSAASGVTVVVNPADLKWCGPYSAALPSRRFVRRSQVGVRCNQCHSDPAANNALQGKWQMERRHVLT
jgi:lysophospholipase L1-like esterase